MIKSLFICLGGMIAQNTRWHPAHIPPAWGKSGPTLRLVDRHPRALQEPGGFWDILPWGEKSVIPLPALHSAGVSLKQAALSLGMSPTAVPMLPGRGEGPGVHRGPGDRLGDITSRQDLRW